MQNVITQSLIIDCDPGVDDAMALMLAFTSSELELLAVTTVCGNGPLAKTSRNARILREIAGRADVPIHGGAERPLRRKPSGATEFHGVEGLGSLVPVEPMMGLAVGHAADVIINAAMQARPGTLSLAVLGPMTNLALALRKEPAIAQRFGRVAVMGGARSEGGNITPSAEFNVWADPEAADEVMRSGLAVTLFGLDVTHQVRATDERISAIEALDTAEASTVAAMMSFSREVERTIVGGDAPPIHDVCPIAWLLRADLFELRACRIHVETRSDLTRGHTSVDFRVDEASAPHRWAVSAEAQGVFDLIVDRMRRPGSSGDISGRRPG